MNRLEFMKELELLLSGIPQSEREEAIQYYNDYLNDAGVENEQEVLDSLGTPQDLAKVILEGLNDNGENGEFTETGYQNGEGGTKNELARRGQAEKGRTAENGPGTGTETGAGTENGNGMGNGMGSGMGNGMRAGTGKNTGQGFGSGQTRTGAAGKDFNVDTEKKKEKQREPLSAGMIVLIVILGIIAFPVLAGIATGVLGAGLGILGGILGLVIGVAAAGIGLLVAAVILVCLGIAAMVSVPLAGICFIGLGILFAGIALFFLWLTVWIFAVALPWVIRGMVNLCGKIFHRKGEGNA